MNDDLEYRVAELEKGARWWTYGSAIAIGALLLAAFEQIKGWF